MASNRHKPPAACCFGPWATTLDAGTSARLSTFWKKRMAMLAATRQTLPGISPRAILPLLLAVTATLAAPTLYLSPAPAAPPESSNNTEAATNGAAPDVPKKEAEAADNALAGRPAPQAGQPVRVELPGGGILELVAIGEHPSTDGPWWAPDGTLTARPYDTFKSHVTDNSKVVREFAVRWVKRPAEDVTAVMTEIKGGRSSANGQVFDRNGRAIEGLGATACAFPAGIKTCAFAITVAGGPWETLAETDGDSNFSQGSIKYTVAFAPAAERKGDIVLTVSHNVQDKEVRIIAVDRDGKKIVVGNSSAVGGRGFTQTTATFPQLDEKAVRKFHFQVRDWQYFEIRDISLLPGEATQPKVVQVEETERLIDFREKLYRQRMQLLDKVDGDPDVSNVIQVPEM